MANGEKGKKKKNGSVNFQAAVKEKGRKASPSHDSGRTDALEKEGTGQ